MSTLLKIQQNSLSTINPLQSPRFLELFENLSKAFTQASSLCLAQGLLSRFILGYPEEVCFMKILIVKHADIEGPGLIEAYLKQEKMAYEILSLPSGRAFPKLDEVGPIILLGGPMNVYEEERYPFLQKEDLCIKEAIQRGKPLLGICFGAQLIAKALGAKVYRACQKEIGWYEITLTEEGLRDPLFSSLPKTFPVFQWHGDTFDIPKGSRLLGTSSPVSHQGFRYGENAYGLQFHLEVTREMIREWMEEYDEEFDPSARAPCSKSRILAETENKIKACTGVGIGFFERFFKQSMQL